MKKFRFFTKYSMAIRPAAVYVIGMRLSWFLIFFYE